MYVQAEMIHSICQEHFSKEQGVLFNVVISCPLDILYTDGVGFVVCEHFLTTLKIKFPFIAFEMGIFNCLKCLAQLQYNVWLYICGF